MDTYEDYGGSSYPEQSIEEAYQSKYESPKPTTTKTPEHWYPRTAYQPGERLIDRHGNLLVCVHGGMSDWGTAPDDAPVLDPGEKLVMDGTVVWYAEPGVVPLPDKEATTKIDLDLFEEREI